MSLFAAIAMLGAFVSSLYRVIRAYSWVVLLSNIVCGVALMSYLSILYALNINRERVGHDGKAISPTRVVVTPIRYIDWILTLHILSLKLLAMARDGPESASYFLGIDLDNEYTNLIGAYASIACVGLGYFGSAVGAYTHHNRWHTLAFFVLATGMMCVSLTLIYAIALQTKTRNRGRIFLFSIAWAVYPIVYILKEFELLTDEDEFTAYAALDVYTKAAFTFETVLTH